MQPERVHALGDGDVAAGQRGDDAAVVDRRLAVEGVGERAHSQRVVRFGDGVDPACVGDAGVEPAEHHSAITVGGAARRACKR